MVESVDFAKYILLKARERGINDVNLTKLQKLLYICDGLLLAFGLNAIKENARAWNYGPVYPKVYKWFSKNQDCPLSEADIPEAAMKEITEGNYGGAVSAALDAFGDWNAMALSAWSHQPGSPWEKAVSGSRGKMNAVISKDEMARYFKEIAYEG